MSSIFDNQDRKADKKLELKANEQILRLMTSKHALKRGTLKKSTYTDDEEFINFVGILFSDRLIYVQEKGKQRMPKQLSINWKGIYPFSETNPAGYPRYGFRIQGQQKVVEFYVDTPNDLDSWMAVLGPWVIQNEIEDDFQIAHEIGHGTYARVYSARSHANGDLYAVKKISKDVLDRNYTNMKALLNEIKVLRYCNHPEILKLHHIYEDSRYIHLVTEYMPEGELFKRIYKRKQFTEPDTRTFMKKLLESLQYLHQNDIVHRDIKLENILMREEHDDTQFVLADFGLATWVLGAPCSMKWGSPGYTAPEVLSGGPYDFKVDIFSAGILMYILLTGSAVFSGKDEKSILNSNKLCDIKFPHHLWKSLSSDAFSLVKSLLQTDPRYRPTAKEALKHPWFNVRRAAVFRTISHPPSPITTYNPMRSTNPNSNQESPRGRDSRQDLSPRGRNSRLDCSPRGRNSRPDLASRGRSNRHVSIYDHRRDLNGSILKRRGAFDGLASVIRDLK